MPFFSVTGASLVGSHILAMRNVVLEEFTLNLASEYSILYGTGQIHYDDDHQTSAFNPESLLNNSIPPKDRLLRYPESLLNNSIPPKERFLALERSSDLETDPLLSRSNSPILSSSHQPKKIRFASHYNDDDPTSFSNKESLLNNSIPPKGQLLAVERSSDSETDPLLSRSNFPILSSSHQPKKIRFASHYNDDDPTSFSNKESLLNNSIPPKGQLLAVERSSDLETDSLLSRSNSPSLSSSPQPKKLRFASNSISDKGKGPSRNDDDNIEEQQNIRRLLTISRSIKLPLVTINAQGGILDTKLILEETKSKIYKQFQYSVILLLVIIIICGMAFSHIEKWTFLNGNSQLTLRILFCVWQYYYDRIWRFDITHQC
jgi:hypothetical protein